MESIKESIERDLAKLTPKSGYKPMWVLAAINNQKQKVCNIRKVEKLQNFICW